MLYDKRWDRTETKPDALSLESLISWLEMQPAKKSYLYTDCSGKCLYGLYMASHGIGWVESGACGASCSSLERSDFCVVVYDYIASCRPWTFGAALDRARSVVPSAQRGVVG